MAYTQDERMCQVSCPLGDNVLLLAELNAQESISRPFFFDLQLMSVKDNLAFGALIGKPLAIHLELASGSERYFHGIVSRFSQGPSVSDLTSYRAEVVPFLWLLRRRMGCRIFQHKSVPDIIKKILGETGFSDYEFQLSGEHPEREYCVQFRESDLAFISRLSEEEGISYFFKHSEKAHTLVFFDSPSANAPCPGQTSCVYGSAEDTTGPGASVLNWRMEQEFAVGKVALTDYNFEDPSMNLLASAATAHPMGGNDKFEVYQFPGEYTTLSEGERRAKLRMQAEEAAAVCARAQSSCAAFTPGFRFDLQGHYRPDYNVPYLITEVVHRVSQDVGDAGRQNSYANDFTCMPYSVPYRPQLRTPKPLIYGVQTATVVGAPGKEIDVDSHGRVVVQFHWDREGKRDENSSCRVRVSQNWAGKGWGSVSIPRIDQEVIVDFLEGDPDRPLITGRVYNGQNKLPYADAGHMSGMKSNSTPGGGGSNEMSMDDTKGKEKITIHGQHDMATTVKHDRSTTVETGNDTLTVQAGTRTVTVKGNTSLTVQAGSRSVSVTGGSYGADVSGGDFAATASAAVKLHGKGAGVTVIGNGGTGVKVDATPNFDASGASLAKLMSPKVEIGNAQIDVKGSTITIDGSSTVKLISGGSSIEITPGGITINSSGPVTVTGAVVKVNS